jgi:nucleotide-binding universal stress UspA family protein
VVVVPSDTDPERPITNIIVGVDGSPSSTAALRWAVEYGGPEATVHAVGCVEPPSLDSTPAESAAKEADLMDQVTGLVTAVKSMVDEAGLEVGELDARVEVGDPREVLRQLAANADLLVVGSRSRHGVSYLLLGSTASALLDHPVGPTVVVPDEVE